jgi:integrating conjugative element protein (TIGR03757 family)
MSPVAKGLLFWVGSALMSPATVAAGGGGDPSLIEAFTTSAIAIDRTTLEATVFEIDGLERLDRELSEGLPAEPDEAKRMALERIGALGDALRSRAEIAAEGLGLAHHYDIKKLPAVVFDGGGSVVYGVTDLGEALRIYREGDAP